MPRSRRFAPPILPRRRSSTTDSHQIARKFDRIEREIRAAQAAEAHVKIWPLGLDHGLESDDCMHNSIRLFYHSLACSRWPIPKLLGSNGGNRVRTPSPRVIGTIEGRSLARAASRRMGRYPRHASHVDANGGQGWGPRPESETEPLLGRSAAHSPCGLTTLPIPYALGIFTLEFDFIDHVLRITTSRNQIETILLVPRTASQNFIREFTAVLASLKINAKIWRIPVRSPKSDPFRQGHPARFLRSRIPKSLLAHPSERRHDLPGISRALHRESQPRAFLLGKLRSRRIAFFRAPRPGTSRRGRMARESYSHG